MKFFKWGKKQEEQQVQAVAAGKSKKGFKALVIGGGATMAVSAMAGSASAAGPNTVDFTGVNVGITPGDILTSSVGFYSLFTAFIVLVLAIKFAPNLMDFLFGIFGRLKGGKRG